MQCLISAAAYIGKERLLIKALPDCSIIHLWGGSQAEWYRGKSSASSVVMDKDGYDFYLVWCGAQVLTEPVLGTYESRCRWRLVNDTPFQGYKARTVEILSVWSLNVRITTTHSEFMIYSIDWTILTIKRYWIQLSDGADIYGEKRRIKNAIVMKLSLKTFCGFYWKVSTNR